MSSASDTIAAVATPPGVGGVAIVRVSGPLVQNVINEMILSHRSPLLSPRFLISASVISSISKEIIDTGLVVFFCAPKSFTGEDVLEFHLHGSVLVSQLVLRSLANLGVRLAEPGEFTKRAFLNGKLDIFQVEAIGQVISAASERGLAVAHEHLAGKLSLMVNQIAEPLRDILAEIEAALDFPEEDIELIAPKRLALNLSGVIATVSRLISTYSRGRVLREGIKILLCGVPNVGKSSLLNKILGIERAIVSDRAGTTRDFIEETCRYNGFSFTLCDAAGIRDSDDPIEQAGVLRTRNRFQWADIIVLIYDGSLQKVDSATLRLAEELNHSARPVISVVNKSDLLHQKHNFTNDDIIFVSATTGSGINELLDSVILKILANAKDQQDLSTSAVVITEERHHHLLVRCCDALNRTHSALLEELPLEVVSAELRHALQQISELVGLTDNEDILGRIFSRYCIGK
jgi:tRNA modification GTPase